MEMTLLQDSLAEVASTEEDSVLLKQLCVQLFFCLPYSGLHLGDMSKGKNVINFQHLFSACYPFLSSQCGFFVGWGVIQYCCIPVQGLFLY